MGEHICGEVESLFIGSAVSLCASILMFVLWMVAVICICRHNNMKWKKKKKFLYIAIPAWISVTSEPFFLYGFAKFFTVKTYLAPYDIQKENAGTQKYAYGLSFFYFLQVFGSNISHLLFYNTYAKTAVRTRVVMSKIESEEVISHE